MALCHIINGCVSFFSFFLLDNDTNINFDALVEQHGVALPIEVKSGILFIAGTKTTFDTLLCAQKQFRTRRCEP